MDEFAAGLAGGCAGVIVGHPLDTIKVKLQTQDFNNPRYRGTWDCFKKTVAQDGTRGLYRGLTSPLAGVGAVNAVIFGVHGNVARQFQDPDALKTHFAAGVCAGVAQAFICSPVELAKTRLQIQADALSAGTISKATYSGPLDCLRQMYRSEGIKGVFRGQLITIAREIPAFGTYFLSYEWMVRKMQRHNCEPSTGAILFAGGMAGCMSWLVSYPVDVIKSRLQSDGAFGAARRYTGVVDCLRISVHEEGFRVLSRGLSSTLLRAFPTNAATFFVVSHVTRHLQQNADSLDMTALREITRAGESILRAAHLGGHMQNYGHQMAPQGITPVFDSNINLAEISSNYIRRLLVLSSVELHM